MCYDSDDSLPLSALSEVGGEEEEEEDNVEYEPVTEDENRSEGTVDTDSDIEVIATVFILTTETCGSLLGPVESKDAALSIAELGS